MMVDTDVLIWYMRGNEKARRLIEETPGFFISVITYMELIQGMRNNDELREFRKALKSWNARILYVDEDISTKAMVFIEKHYLSHSLEIADALIGATAVAHAVPIVTGNSRHYRAIREIEVRMFRP